MMVMLIADTKQVSITFFLSPLRGIENTSTWLATPNTLPSLILLWEARAVIPSRVVISRHYTLSEKLRMPKTLLKDCFKAGARKAANGLYIPLIMRVKVREQLTLTALCPKGIASAAPVLLMACCCIAGGDCSHTT